MSEAGGGLRAFAAAEGRLARLPANDEALDGAVWIDLIDPAPEQVAAVERAFGVDVPTREEMEEIEASSRLYQEDGVAVMTAILPAAADTAAPEIGPVTFVLTADRLVTLRYHTPRAFESFPARAERAALGCDRAETVLMGLLEAVVDRLADILEGAGREIERLSTRVFGDAAGGKRDYDAALRGVGRIGDLLSHVRDSLASIERLFGFLALVLEGRKAGRELRARVKTQLRDVRSLVDHAGFLSQKATFLLDATLGLINIEQSNIIKIFSVVAVAFLPPTLIASIYGMNFEHMPELGWPFGYPMALGLMVLSGVLPLVYFKRRGWL